MRRRRWIERGVYGVALVAIATAGLAWHGATTTVRPVAGVAQTSVRTADGTIAMPAASSLAVVTATIALSDPFRLDHRPSAVAFKPGAEVSPVASAPLGRIIAKGVVGGPPWQAVLDSVPGRNDNVVARVGDTLRQGPIPIVVRSIRADMIILAVGDSTMRLPVTGVWR